MSTSSSLVDLARSLEVLLPRQSYLILSYRALCPPLNKTSATSTIRGMAAGAPENRSRTDDATPGVELKRAPQPPFLAKVGHATHIYTVQGFLAPVLWLRSWKEWFYPQDGGPNFVKAYECRPSLPVRCVAILFSAADSVRTPGATIANIPFENSIFFPSTYDQTSPTDLRTPSSSSPRP